MSFHIEHYQDGRHHRSGVYASRGDAVLAALRVKAAPVLIVEGDDSVSPGGGDVVAVVLKAGEIINVGEKPSWWAELPNASQEKVLEGGRLDAAVVTAVAHAGGSVAATAWEGGPADEWELTPAEDHTWVRAEAARRIVRGR